MAEKLDPSLLIPDKKWNANQWVDLYENLVDYFGSKKEARTLWLSAWTKRGSSDANTAELRHKMKENGIDIPSNSIGGSILDAGNSYKDIVGNVFSIGGKIGAVYAVVVVVITLIVVFKLIKMLNPESVGTIVKYAK